MVRLTGSITRRMAAKAGLAATTLAAVTAGFAGMASAAEPRPWEFGFQPAATPITQRIDAFNIELLVIIAVITAIVLALLLYVIVRFRASRNPVPSQTTHNSVVEYLWTIIPVVILVAIAIPSFKLMYYMDDVPAKTAMTINVTGHQWYWSYAYPNNGNFTFNSNMVQAKDLKPGQLRMLTVDNPLVIPVDTDIRVLVTSTDVIHSFFVPSFGVQEYAVIGRRNHAWMRVLKTGTYYGECNQICGVNHSYMPIEVKVLSKEAFQKWVATAKKQFASDTPAPAAKPAPADAPKLAAAGDTLVAAAGN